MYSKEEEKELKIAFWGELNEQLSLERGFHGNKVNWMNFNTKIRPIYFRMEADGQGVRLCIDVQFHDKGIQEIYYEQFTEFKNILEERFSDNLPEWMENYEHWNGKTISRIVIDKPGLSMSNKDNWEEAHAFLKNNFIKLEHFWAEFGEVFVNLKE